MVRVQVEYDHVKSSTTVILGTSVVDVVKNLGLEAAQGQHNDHGRGVPQYGLDTTQCIV